MSQFIKFVAAVVVGVLIAAFIIKEYTAYRINSALDAVSKEMEAQRAIEAQKEKEAQELEEKARAKAEADWQDMVDNGLHPGLIGKDQEEN